MNKVLLALALYVLLFANAEEGRALLFQLGGVAIITITAIMSVARTGISGKSLSMFEASLLGASCLSLVVSVFYQVTYISLYTITFLYVVCIVAITVRTLSLQDILSGSSYSYIAMLLTCYLFTRQEMSDALNISFEDHWALRYGPFGLHPNLTGFIFGGGVAVFITQAMLSNGKMTLVFACLASLSIRIILASSSRASFVALVLAAAVAFLINIRRINIRVIVGALVLSSMLFLMKAQTLFDYLAEIFELSSADRGIDSGGSGRLELWWMGLAKLFSDPIQLLMGGGLRSSSYELLGFHTENSYLTILLDSGVVAGTIIIFAVFRLIFRLVAMAKSARNSEFLLHTGVVLILTYAVAESLFNRYLIAIGNPLSVLFLLVCAKAGVVFYEISPARECACQNFQADDNQAA